MQPFQYKQKWKLGIIPPNWSKKIRPDGTPGDIAGVHGTPEGLIEG